MKHNIGLFTKNQAQILAILFHHPEKEFSLSELGETLKKHPGVFRRGINSLEKYGIIYSNKRANQRLFKINVSNPFFKELKSIIEKTEGVQSLLASLVNKIKTINTAIIFGSYASNKTRPSSDIDLLLVVTDEDVENILLDKIKEIEHQISREINYRIYMQDEFNKKLQEKDPFLEDVFSKKHIFIKGIIEK